MVDNVKSSNFERGIMKFINSYKISIILFNCAMFFFMIAHSNSQKLHVRNPIKTGSTDKFDISQSKKIVKDKDKRCNLEANKFKVIKVKEDDHSD